MARTLPWLSKAGDKSRVKSENDAKPAIKRRRLSPAEDEEDGGDDRRRPSSAGRHPSSSPAPVLPPAEEEYLREGRDADDGWIVVEDEFWSTARYFTRHIHHEELDRQIKLAKSRNEGATRDIARSVDGRTQMSNATKIKKAGMRQRQRGEDALAGLYSDEEAGEEDDDPWLRDPRLAWLMKPKEMSAPLGKIAGIKSNTRASHGLSQNQSPPRARKSGLLSSQSEMAKSPSRPARNAPRQVSFEDDEDSDDLDAPSYAKPLSARFQSVAQRGPGPAKASVMQTADTSFLSISKPEPSAPASRSSSSNRVFFDDDSDDDMVFPPPRKQQAKAKSTIAQRLESPKKEKEKRKPLKADEIPTFLF